MKPYRKFIAATLGAFGVLASGLLTTDDWRSVTAAFIVSLCTAGAVWAVPNDDVTP